MEEILRNAQGSDEDGWKQWLQVMNENAALEIILRRISLISANASIHSPNSSE